jgi:hypothetical protein
MKTAEEWIKEKRIILDYGLQVEKRDLFKQIQLDAYKAGMTEARGIVRGFGQKFLALRIEHVRDNKKEV